MWKIINDNISIAFDSIKSQLLRAIITLLIIALGIMALVGTLTVVKGIESSFSSSLQSMGSNKFTFKRYENQFNKKKHNKWVHQKVNPRVTFRDAYNFKNRYKEDDALISISFFAGRDLEIKNNLHKTDPKYLIFGIDENYTKVNAFEIKDGKDFSEKDISNNKYYAIIGKDLESDLFPNINPIGKEIIIRGNRFKIIGTLKSKQSNFTGSQNNKIFIPLNLARSVFSKSASNYSITVAVKNKSTYDYHIGKSVSLMRNIRKLQPSEVNNFGITRSDKLEGELREVSSSLNILAFIIGLITILGSSIALMNIMLVSVTERTREIGVRKAIGANSSLIMIQFFVETLVITFLGGLVGILFGLLIGLGVSAQMDMPFAMPWNAIAMATVVIFIVAFFSGLYPAYKASKLDPIQALRHE
jgi:putative ABC transport system permease protein